MDQRTDDGRRCLTVAEVCERLNISRATLYALFDRPDGLPRLTIGRCVRVLESDLDRFIQRARR